MIADFKKKVPIVRVTVNIVVRFFANIMTSAFEYPGLVPDGLKSKSYCSIIAIRVCIAVKVSTYLDF